MTYPIAPNGIFWTIQGEGALLGTPMHFVRLAGCSIGCPECDTDYSVAERLSVAEIIERIQRLPATKWAWITGGEPTDHDCKPLINALHDEGYLVGLATAGTRRVSLGVDFLSVSPHSPTWVKQHGNQINIVPGLNGLQLSDIGDCTDFEHRYVTPCDGKPETLAECLDWLQRHPKWKLGVQAHKTWGVA